MATHARHPIFARVYARIADGAAARGASEHRARLLAGLSGRIIELGAGSGLTFAHYPASVAEVVALEPLPYLRRRAERAAAAAPVAVTVLEGYADALPFSDGTFDAAVTSLMLCSVPDQAAALAEVARVVRTGGELRFYEHVVAGEPGYARFQQVVDTVWPYFGAGCHVNRDTVAAVEASGWHLEEVDSFRFRPFLFTAPVAPHTLGRARIGCATPS